jgi:hypothetical protein
MMLVPGAFPSMEQRIERIVVIALPAILALGPSTR